MHSSGPLRNSNITSGNQLFSSPLLENCRIEINAWEVTSFWFCWLLRLYTVFCDSAEFFYSEDRERLPRLSWSLGLQYFNVLPANTGKWWTARKRSRTQSPVLHDFTQHPWSLEKKNRFGSFWTINYISQAFVYILNWCNMYLVYFYVVSRIFIVTSVFSYTFYCLLGSWSFVFRRKM